MQILLYHEKPEAQRDILSRAAQRSHLMRRTILWDLLLPLLLTATAALAQFYSYKLSHIPILRAIFPVNNCVWEQLKILFFPTLLIAVVRYLCTGGLQKGILTTYAEGLLLTELLAVAGLYTLRGILGTYKEWQSIAVFCASTVFLTGYLIRRSNRQKCNNLPGMLLLLVMEAAFFRFTAVPPQIGLFMPI